MHEVFESLKTEGNIVTHLGWRNDHAELIERRILALAPTTKAIRTMAMILQMRYNEIRF